MAPFTDGFVSFGGFKTWYQTAGDLRSRAPLVLLHGGPGIPGNSYAQLMADLADSRPVVRYDQLGCGRSDRPNDPSLWRVETFLDELAATAWIAPCSCSARCSSGWPRCPACRPPP